MSDLTILPIPPDSIEELVSQVVAVRDKLKDADEAHKTKTAKARAYKDQLEAKLLERLNTLGGDSIKTSAGTVYRSSRQSASIADGALFRDYIIKNAAFDLVDWKANAPAVGDFIKQQTTPPPGINYTLAYTVGVRRA